MGSRGIVPVDEWWMTAGAGPAAVDTAGSLGEAGRCTPDGGGKPEKEGMAGWRNVLHVHVRCETGGEYLCLCG